MVRIGFIGTGNVARLHADGVIQSRHAEMGAVWSRTGAKARAFADEFGTTAAGSLEDLLSDDSLDAVCILTDSFSHAEYATAAIDAGRHVLVEKPLAMDPDGVAALRERALQRGVAIIPVHNYVYAEGARRLRHQLSQPRAGRLQSIWALYNQQHPREFGEPDTTMREVMVHHAYSLLFFAGRPDSVYTTASNVHFSNPEAHDQIHIVARYANGVIATLWGSFAGDDRSAHPWTWMVKLMTTNSGGTLQWDVIKHADEFLPGWDDAAYADSFFFFHDYVSERVLTHGELPLSTIDDALDAACILEAARRSIDTGVTEPVRYRD
ncbi:MAG: Gfo/Idh/MocA family oxidoreductase [Pseudomonadota bacterium]